jgi:chloramphenicol 3-O-phosphotransferase
VIHNTENCRSGQDPTPIADLSVRSTSAEQRELARGHTNTIGLARGHLPTVHNHGYAYDTIVDTSTATPAELAGIVLRQHTAHE